MFSEFIWDPAKARANWRKHGVTFEEAAEACRDPNSIEEIDADPDYGEVRFKLMGYARGRVLAVSYVEREARIRIISARKGNALRKLNITRRPVAKAPVTDVSRKRGWRPPEADEEINAAALTDPDNPPMTDAELARMKPVARSKRIRFALHLTQEQFCERYQIPLGTLRDWEQYRTEPDAPAKAYLSAIAGAPDLVFEALSRDKVQQEAERERFEKAALSLSR